MTPSTSRAAQAGPAARSRWRRALWLLAALAVVGAALAWGVANAGHWLVVEDPLDRADAVLVLTGDAPFRAIEAARIVTEGWTGAVWLTRGAAPERDAAFAKLGVQLLHEEHYNTLVLQRLGVPAPSIRVLPRAALNTTQELQLAADELRRAGGRRLIVVTSRPHSRRVRATWRALSPISTCASGRRPKTPTDRIAGGPARATPSTSRARSSAS